MRSARFRLTGPALTILGILLAGTCAMPFIGAATIDTESIRREEQLVQRNMLLWIQEMENGLKPYSISDEAVKRIDNSFDASWVKRNLAPLIFSGTQSRMVAILDGEGGLLAYETFERTPNDSLFRRRSEQLLARGRLLVRNARVFEAARRPTIAPEKIADSAIMMVEGVAVLITATVIQPDFRDSVPKGPKAPILITARPIDSAIVDTFGDRLFLRDALLQWMTSATEVAIKDLEAAGFAHARVASDGPAEIHLVWKPHRPGRTMLEKALPLMGVSILAFLVGALFLLNITRRATDSLIASEAQLRHAAAHDVLTGLKNRRTFEETLDSLAAEGPLTLACFDLDAFKPINDHHGHGAGDAVLIAVAERLRRAVRPQDEIFRLGGDEFAVLLPGLVGPQARAFCRTIAAILAAPIKLPDAEVRVGASVGLATADGSCNVKTVLKRADASLYRAKAARRASPVVVAETAGADDTPLTGTAA